jgi:hypothetical protein
VPRRSVSQLGQIDAEHMVEELFRSLLRPVRRTDPVAEPHSGRIGKLQCDADAPGLPDHLPVKADRRNRERLITDPRTLWRAA